MECETKCFEAAAQEAVFTYYHYLLFSYRTSMTSIMITILTATSVIFTNSFSYF